MPVTGKKVTWERADMALLAIMDLYECEDLAGFDPGGIFTRTLDKAATAAREIRDRCPEPDGRPASLSAFSDFANTLNDGAPGHHRAAAMRQDSPEEETGGTRQPEISVHLDYSSGTYGDGQAYEHKTVIYSVWLQEPNGEYGGMSASCYASEIQPVPSGPASDPAAAR